MSTQKSSISRYVIYAILIIQFGFAGQFLYSRYFDKNEKRISEEATQLEYSAQDIRTKPQRSSMEKRVVLSKLNQLNVEQNALNDEIEQLKNKLNNEDDAENGLPNNSDLTPEEQDERNVEMFESHIDLLNEQIDSEVFDAEWAPSASDHIYQTFVASNMMNNVSSKCQSTICKVDFEFAGDLPASENMELIQRHPPWDSPFFLKLNEDGKSGMFYIAREGYALPRPEEQI